MRVRTWAAAAVAAALALGLAGCGEPEADEDDAGAAVAVVEFGNDDERDGWDCERTPTDDERRRRETPDCGRYMGGRYVEWSWVARGETPPPGWTPASETRAASAPRPKASPTKTTRVTRPTPKRSRRP